MIGPVRLKSATTGWIAMKFGADVHEDEFY